jgi:ADP-heptose:LPS heptosyltransferase
MRNRRGILLVRLKSIGDILFTLPSVHALRGKFPESRISFLISKEYAPLLEGFRDVNQVFELDRSRFRGLHPMKVATAGYSILRMMRRERLRLAIDLQGYGETAFLTWASGARERWGIFYRSTRTWAYTQSARRDTAVHPAADFLQLLRKSGLGDFPVKNEFVLPQRILAEAAKFFSVHGLQTSKHTLFIQPFTSAPEKNWPLERYVQLAHLWRVRGWQVLFGGGPTDRNALAMAAESGYPIAAGTPLLLSAGLANLSTLVLGGDTGLLHIAVAMGKRVVMLMRSILPGSTHPFLHSDWAIGPQAEGLINSISVEMVDENCTHACAEIGLAL